MIHDMAFAKDGSNKLWSAGVKHMYMHLIDAGDKKKGLFKDFDRCSFACVTADDKGRAFCGGDNACIYVFNGNTAVKSLAYHKPPGFVGAITFSDGHIFSGAKDGRVVIFSTEGNFDQVNVIELGVLPRAIDVHEGNLIVGLRTGSIVEVNLESNEITTHVQSHNSGEVWGLDSRDGMIYTSGDDNQVIRWDVASRTCKDRAIVNTAERRARKNKASTLSRLPHS
jgi:WD40 repeat protein